MTCQVSSASGRSSSRAFVVAGACSWSCEWSCVARHFIRCLATSECRASCLSRRRNWSRCFVAFINVSGNFSCVAVVVIFTAFVAAVRHLTANRVLPRRRSWASSTMIRAHRPTSRMWPFCLVLLSATCWRHHMKSVGALFHGALVASSAAPCGATNLAVKKIKITWWVCLCVRTWQSGRKCVGPIFGRLSAKTWGPKLF